jgi:hypothetical protein
MERNLSLIIDMMLSVTSRRKTRLFINYLFTFSLIIIGPLQAQVSEVEQFILVKEDSPVFVYERWITFPNKVPEVRAREVKGEFLINGSIYQILSILKDESKIKLWQSHVSNFRVHLLRDTTNWMEYSYHDLPWPVSDQDHFIRYTLMKNYPDKELVISFESAIDARLAPEKKGVTRLELSGSWRMEQLSPQQAKITYRILSMPGTIPRMFTDPIIRSNLMSTIKALTRLAEESKQRY